MATKTNTTLRTLFVRGVAPSVDDITFRQIFEKRRGVLKCFLIWSTNKDKAGHKGIGFVEFDSAKNATEAMHTLNGHRIADRQIKIEFAKEREEFAQRKKRKIQQLKSTESCTNEEDDPLKVLGKHVRVQTVAVGGINKDLLPTVKHKAEQIGKIINMIYPAPASLCTTAHLTQDGCPPEIALFTYANVSLAMKAVVQLHQALVSNGFADKQQRLWCRQLAGEGAYVKRNKVIVRNLPFNLDEKQLRKLLSEAGYVWKLDIPVNERTNVNLDYHSTKATPGRNSGFAFAYFTTRNDANEAIAKINGQRLNGRIIAVDWAMSKKTFKEHQEQEIDSDADERVQNVIETVAKQNQAESAADTESVKQITSEEIDEDEDPDESETSDQAKADLKRNDEFGSEIVRNRGSGSSARSCENSEEDLSRTVFVSGLSLDITEEILKSKLEQFGPLKSVFIVKDKETGRSRGTAFAEFINACDKDKALESHDPTRCNPSVLKLTAVEIGSRKDKGQKITTSISPSFFLKQAVSRPVLKTLITSRKQEKLKADRRNLYLLQEGKIDETCSVWTELSRTDQAIRKRSQQIKRQKLKNPLFFVSKTRLCIRNLPEWMTERGLEKLIIESIKQRATKAQPVIRQVKLLYDDSPKGKSLRRGFVELDVHEHAMCALRQLNANPEVFGPNRRPIVEFAIDNREIINKREEQINKLKHKALQQGKVINDVSFGYGKKKRKGKKERQREKTKQMNSAPTVTPEQQSTPKRKKRIHSSGSNLMKQQQIISPRQKRRRTPERKRTSPVKRKKQEERDRFDALLDAHQIRRFAFHRSPKKKTRIV